MAIIIQSEFDSAVLESNEDAYTRTYISDKKTIIEFDMRKRDYRQEFGIKTEIFWLFGILRGSNLYHANKAYPSRSGNIR